MLGGESGLLHDCQGHSCPVISNWCSKWPVMLPWAMRLKSWGVGVEESSGVRYDS